MLGPLPKKFPNDLLHFFENPGGSKKNGKLKQGKTVKHRFNEDRLTSNVKPGKAPGKQFALEFLQLGKPISAEGSFKKDKKAQILEGSPVLGGCETKGSRNGIEHAGSGVPAIDMTFSII